MYDSRQALQQATKAVVEAPSLQIFGLDQSHDWPSVSDSLP